MKFQILNHKFQTPNKSAKADPTGQILIQVLVFGAIAVVLIGGLVQWVGLHLRASRQLFLREQASAVAEAGIEYYRWHLAHAAQDFQDGTGGPGPYTHIYYDKDGNAVGRFILTITPPAVGSTLVTIRSEGRVDTDPSVKRTLMVQMGTPSWAKYTYVSNTFVWYGPGEEVFGPIHSNSGIRFDGLAHNLVTSAQTSFNDPIHAGGNEFGVHTHQAPTDPLPPAAVPNRPDVFLAGRTFPVPAVDFAGLSADLAQLKAKAISSGRYLAGSGGLGYRIVLRTDDTFDLYRITSLIAAPAGCSVNQSGWGTWSINAQVFLANYALPANGIIFAEDHVWVEGQIDTARVTIASGRFPEAAATNTNIIVNESVRYTNLDGSDSVGLIAQKNFLIGLRSADNIRIDAAIIAKNGGTIRYYYRSQCGVGYLRNSLFLFGSTASNQQGYFAYVDGGGNIVSGYQNQTASYDASLLYAPPPSFPLTSDQYSTLVWEEVE